MPLKYECILCTSMNSQHEYVSTWLVLYVQCRDYPAASCCPGSKVPQSLRFRDALVSITWLFAFCIENFPSFFLQLRLFPCISTLVLLGKGRKGERWIGLHTVAQRLAQGLHYFSCTCCMLLHQLHQLHRLHQQHHAAIESTPDYPATACWDQVESTLPLISCTSCEDRTSSSAQDFASYSLLCLLYIVIVYSFVFVLIFVTTW